jgi:hypothetical protein
MFMLCSLSVDFVVIHHAVFTIDLTLDIVIAIKRLDRFTAFVTLQSVVKRLVILVLFIDGFPVNTHVFLLPVAFFFEI